MVLNWVCWVTYLLSFKRLNTFLGSKIPKAKKEKINVIIESKANTAKKTHTAPQKSPSLISEINPLIEIRAVITQSTITKRAIKIFINIFRRVYILCFRWLYFIFHHPNCKAQEIAVCVAKTSCSASFASASNSSNRSRKVMVISSMLPCGSVRLTVII